jgi:hypothetical protein
MAEDAKCWGWFPQSEYRTFFPFITWVIFTISKGYLKHETKKPLALPPFSNSPVWTQFLNPNSS